MQKFLIYYKPSLGEFLDEENLNWEMINDEQIYIYAHDAADLFNIACDYAKWAEKTLS